MQPPLAERLCRDHMPQELLDDEDQMASALAEIRNERAEEPTAVIEAKTETPVDVVVPEVPAPNEPATVAAPATPTDPTEQLKLAQAELHKARSEIGRVSALNQKYLHATQEAAALREELAQSRRAPAPPVDTSETVDKLAAVAEQVKDFPELAGIVEAVSHALKQSDKKTEEVARRVAAQVVEPLEPLRREQTTRIENEQKASYDAALATFNSTYPTAVQVVQSDDFNSWLGHQPNHIQYAFVKGQTPGEAMTVLDTYDMHLRRTGQTPIAHFEKTTPNTAAANAKSVPNTNRLQRAAGIPSRTSGAQGGQPAADDFDGALAYFRSKRLAAQRASA